MESVNELGDYLRARRAAVTPADVGLLDDGPRRVPGLRRDEVALLAGMSTDYYVRLEQGRERRPSEQVLRAIAGALRLDDAAAAHLFRLGLSVFGTAAAATSVAPELLRLMDGMRDVPAFVVGVAQDVLAANALARELYGGFARYDNLLRMIFLDPFAREFYVDWDHAARIAVGNLRASSSQFPRDERIEAVVGGLSVRNPAFAGLWARYESGPVRTRTSTSGTRGWERYGCTSRRSPSPAPPDSTCPSTARNPAAQAPTPWSCSVGCPSRKRPRQTRTPPRKKEKSDHDCFAVRRRRHLRDRRQEGRAPRVRHHAPDRARGVG